MMASIAPRARRPEDLRQPVMYSSDPVEVDLAPTDVGEFTVAHGLDHEPYGAIICMTRGGTIWFQTETDGSLKKDTTNVYLVASAAEVTGRVIV